MMVTFVSQCEKNALKKTRRVLDAFADRIGDNTWQTIITEEGLLAVKRLLRKTASKSTAVSCHWIRSRSRTELVWIVGNKNKFNSRGCVPVNSTSKNVSYEESVKDWLYLPVIRALTCVAALLHDWGKANTRFQQKLSPEYTGKGADRLRHEWVSCILLKALINTTNNPTSDGDWLNLLVTGTINEDALKTSLRESHSKPLSDLPPIAKLVAWLIVSHHKLPVVAKPNAPVGSPCSSLDGLFELIDKNWGYENPDAGDLASCLSFPDGLLCDSGKWLSELKRWSGKLLQTESLIVESIANNSFRVLLHHARLALMLGDHYYSSLNKTESGNWKETTSLVANTQKDRSPKQALDQHLVGVCQHAKEAVGKFPLIEANLEQSFNTAELKRKSPPRFSWQDKAAKKIRVWKTENTDRSKGFFAVNMASTGCGKTFANAKVMMALSEEGDSLRYLLALGLRTLTLQTGDEYRERIFNKTDGSDLAVLIGSKAVSELHHQNNQDDTSSLGTQGSESSESLLAQADEVIYDGPLTEDGLSTVLTNNKDKKLLYAPVLVCTIDHIIAATETIRGGRYILPALRLLSSDLVIDEVDDFTGSDLIAIGRLIFLAGMLGRRVMISSATIPPAIAEGYFNCYQSGWSLYCKTRNASKTIGCAWIDEFSTLVTDIEKQEQDGLKMYRDVHEKYVQKRAAKLDKQPAKRKANIVACEQALKTTEDPRELSKKHHWFDVIARECLEKHQGHHFVDDKTATLVSFGVIRTANIQPCVELTRFLLEYTWPDDTEVRIMAYHSRQVLLLRHEQERHLDAVLKRTEKPGETPKSLNNKHIRFHLDNIAARSTVIKNVLFIVVATPVEEVGRDHDFDWAVIEPSSYRSIIQLAGRVRRHRDGEVSQPNVGILQYNWRTVKHGDKPREPRFFRPGYESFGNLKNNKPGAMSSHDLFKVVDQKLIRSNLNAIPRILSSPKNSKTPMALLEHAVISNQLTHYDGKEPETLQGYLQWYWSLTGVPQLLNRFRQGAQTVTLYRVLNDHGDVWFTERDSKGNLQRINANELVRQDDAYNISTVPLTKEQSQRLWLPRDYIKLLFEQSEKSDIPVEIAALRFGELSFDSYQGSAEKFYEYNDQLGLYEQESNDA